MAPPVDQAQVRARVHVPGAVLPPRCVDREGAAAYLGGISTDQIDRLIHAGLLPVVRMPVVRQRQTGRGTAGVNRRVLLDVRDLDALIDKFKEREA